MPNNTIWKYKLDLLSDARAIVSLPGETPRVLSVGRDPQGDVVLWAAVDKDSKRTSTVTISVVGTGNDLPADAGYFLNTFVIGLSYVFHAFYKFEE